MRISSIYIAMFAVSLLSCTGLRKSQVVATENFAIATKGISRVPADIYFRIFQLKAESKSLQLNTILATNDKPKESIALIRDDYEDHSRALQIAEEYSTAYQIVEEYASLVMCLLDESYRKDFVRRKNTWQATFAGLIRRHNNVAVTKIPPAVNNIAGRIIMELGKIPVAKLQKKYLKQAIETARVPFENICDDFIRLDSLKIRGELNNLPAYINNNYANFLENIRAVEKNGNNPYTYFKEYTPLYLNWLTQIDELNSLTVQTVNAFRSLKTTYGVLERFIVSDKPGAVPDEINTLMEEYGKLLNIYKRFQYRREKLTDASLVK
jgi:hypothetical protein